MLARLFTEQFAFSKGDSVVVIGLGRFGGAVANSLMQLGHDVMGIDRDAEPVHEWADLLTHAVQADSTNAMTMRQLGVADFSHAIVGIGGDLAASLMTVMALIELEIPDIWVKAMTAEHGKIAERIGAHHVVYPEDDMGRRVARLITGRMMYYIEVGEGFAVAKVVAPRVIAADALARAAIRERFGVTLIGIQREGGHFEHATPDSQVNDGDVLIVAGPSGQIEKFAGYADRLEPGAAPATKEKPPNGNAVIGQPDEKWGERPLALVVLKPGFEGQVTEHAIRNFAAHLVEATGISRHGVLLQVRFVKALAKTSVGKINKREMRETMLTA